MARTLLNPSGLSSEKNRDNKANNPTQRTVGQVIPASIGCVACDKQPKKNPFAPSPPQGFRAEMKPSQKSAQQEVKKKGN